MIQEKEIGEILRHIEDAGLVPPSIKPLLVEEKKGFQLGVSTRQGTESGTYSVSVERNDNLGVYQLHGYHSTLLRIGDIPHQKVMGIDTAELEREMAKIDWNRIVPFTYPKASGINACLTQLAKISQGENPEGKQVAELLTLKYIDGTALARMFNFGDLRKEYEKNIFVEMNGNGQDISLPESYDLLCGRGVAKPCGPDENKHGICWMVMENAKVRSMPDFDVTQQLEKLPFAKKRSILQIAEDVAKLSAGKQLEGRFKVHGHAFTAYYEADPINGTIAMRDLKQTMLDLQKLSSDPQQLKALASNKKQSERKLGL